jgi:hypothetical protein
MDEDLEKGVIETLSVVISLSFHVVQKKSKTDYRSNVTFVGRRMYGQEDFQDVVCIFGFGHFE